MCVPPRTAVLSGAVSIPNHAAQDKKVEEDMEQFFRQIIAVILSAAAALPPAAPPQPTEDFRSVLLGETQMVLAWSQEKIFLNEYRDDLDFEVEPARFAQVDLDGDGICEIVLWMCFGANMYAEFEILRAENGEIHCYPQVYRGLQDIKTDGTYCGSSGAGDWGYYKILSFGETELEDEPFTWCESSEQGELYYVNKEPASRQEFESACAEQDAKEIIVWYEFTPENIDALL